MGRDTVLVATVTAVVSRHNSDEDKKHDALVEELRKDIFHLAENPKYEPILISTH